MRQAATLGGNVRVGLEDSIWAGKGELATSNAVQVAKVRQIIQGLGLQVATPDEAREILSLKGGDRLTFNTFKENSKELDVSEGSCRFTMRFERY